MDQLGFIIKWYDPQIKQLCTFNIKINLLKNKTNFTNWMHIN